MNDERWARVLTHSNEFTCYSAALATWLAAADDDWGSVVNPGLWLRITEAQDGLFGFGYFPPALRARLGLLRTGTDDAAEAIAGVRAEIERSGRVIVAGDGYRLPWHVASGRQHVPHWFVLTQSDNGLEFADPFACRNELGVQVAARGAAMEESLPELLMALPAGEPVHRLREMLALGDEIPEPGPERYRWFVGDDVEAPIEPVGYDGPDAVVRLARHFRERGQDPQAYSQADDIWSIARHRAFLWRYAEARAQARGNADLKAWVDEHAAPLAKRWGHVAPLLMQATLALSAGRTASASVPETLERLAEQEQIAAETLPRRSITI
ncbi:MAG TPA: hypothetical protein VIX82_03030 [Solirubrobacteraceae bacterium]